MNSQEVGTSIPDDNCQSDGFYSLEKQCRQRCLLDKEHLAIMIAAIERDILLLGQSVKEGARIPNSLIKALARRLGGMPSADDSRPSDTDGPSVDEIADTKRIWNSRPVVLDKAAAEEKRKAERDRQNAAVGRALQDGG